MRPVILTDRVVLLCGDSRTIDFGEGTVDAIVTDPPYELGFMAKAWDKRGIAYDIDLWRVVWRTLKPGGHLLAFGGTRTYHRMTCAIEDAGFEVRDSLHWVYGSGFPKSLNISKEIDKRLGTERPMVGENPNHRAVSGTSYEGVYAGKNTGAAIITAPGSPEAAAWDGWGTALKPAHEPIVLARKPLIDPANGKMTVAECVLAHGTGGLNVDGCRIGNEVRFNPAAANTGQTPASIGPVNTTGYKGSYAVGRWPANFVLSHLDECELAGSRQVDRMIYRNVDEPYSREGTIYDGGWRKQRVSDRFVEDEQIFRCAPGCPVGYLGEPARFFYCAKPSRKERDYGCEALPARTGGEATGRVDGSAGTKNPRAGAGRTGGARNYHPTVKPIDLMRWLCRLVTPPGGVVLDPFTGSGTTGIAALREGFKFIGIEQSEEYVEIAKARLLRALKESEG